MSIRIPSDASVNVQASFRDVEAELRGLKRQIADIRSGVDTDNLSDLRREVVRLTKNPTYRTWEEVFGSLYIGEGPGIKRLKRALIISYGAAGLGVLTTGYKGSVPIPFACTITEWVITSNIPGSIVIDVWKDTYTNAPPTVVDSIAGLEKPTLVTAQKNRNLNLINWINLVAAGDHIGFNIDSITTIEQVTLQLTLNR